MAKKIALDSSTEMIDRTREALERMAALVNGAGIPVTAYVSPDLPVFREQPLADQMMLLRELEDRVELFSAAQLEGIDLRDTRQMLWRSLRKAGWVPSSDVFDSIEDGDSVEVYSLEMKQIFRNLELFRWLSYTLEEVHGGRWYDLVSRDEATQKQLMEAALKIATGQVTRTLDVSYIAPHICVETTSQERRKFLISMKVISPVYSDGVLSAFISVNKTTAV